MIKKVLIAAFITVVVLFGFKFGIQYYNDNFTKMSKVASQEISTVDEMQDILDNNDKVYLYVGRPDCPDSDQFEEYFIPFMEENNVDNIVFFNIKDIVEEHGINNEYKKILLDKFGVRNTPTLAYYEEGNLVILSEWTTEKGYNEEMAMDFVERSGLVD